MRLQINWICLALLLSTPVFAVERVRPKLQGEWSRVDHQTRYKISGNRFIEYKANNPNAPNQISAINYPFGKSYAEVTTQNGKLKIYSGGANIIAVESFDKTGSFIDDGIVFHRHGKAEWSDPQTPIGNWTVPGEPSRKTTFFSDGTAKVDYHDQDCLWNQDADGVVRAILAAGHRKVTTYKLSDDGQEMTVIASNHSEKDVGGILSRIP